jgi:Secretory lipase
MHHPPSAPRRAALLWLALFVTLLGIAPRAYALPAEFVGSIEAFYTAPATQSQLPHGTLIRWQRMVTLSPGLTFNSDGVAAFRVMYVSQADDQQKLDTRCNNTNTITCNNTYVTGTVLVPARVYNGFWGFPQAPRPIIGFAAGTQGFADQYASSFGLQQSTNYDIVLIRQALDKGWAVVVSDYQGLGTRYADGRADDHTYVVGRILGKNVIDAVRASLELDAVATSAIKNIDFPLRIGIDAVLRSYSRVAFWGYSEGGMGAAWAAELQPSYDAGLNVKGVAAGGTPADLLATGIAVNTPYSPAFGVLLGTVIGYKQAYPALPLYLNTSGVNVLNTVRTQNVAEAVILNFGGHTFADYAQPGFNPLTDAAWKSKLDRNKLGKWFNPLVPAFVYHSVQDEALPYAQGRQMARDWCARGTRVTWKGYVGEHLTGFVAGMGDALTFLDAVLRAQTPASTPCSNIN